MKYDVVSRDIFDQIKIERRSKGGGRIQPINIQ